MKAFESYMLCNPAQQPPCTLASKHVCISYCSRCSYFLSVFLHHMPYFTPLPLNVTVLYYNVLQAAKCKRCPTAAMQATRGRGSTQLLLILDLGI
jgi:hypothetical protein